MLLATRTIQMPCIVQARRHLKTSANKVSGRASNTCVQLVFPLRQARQTLKLDINTQIRSSNDSRFAVGKLTKTYRLGRRVSQAKRASFRESTLRTREKETNMLFEMQFKVRTAKRESVGRATGS